MRWVLVACAACGSASHPVEGPDAASGVDGGAPKLDAASSRPLRVLTMNLKTPLPSDASVDQRTQLVAQLIATEQPDVIALQEVTQSGSLANRAEVLGALTGYAWQWRRTHQLGIGD